MDSDDSNLISLHLELQHYPAATPLWIHFHSKSKKKGNWNGNEMKELKQFYALTCLKEIGFVLVGIDLLKRKSKERKERNERRIEI